MDFDGRSAATVHLWVAPLLVPSSLRRALEASLTRAERTRAERYRHPQDARRFSAARGWLRHVLATEVGTQPAEVHMSQDPGKPRLASEGGPFFNLSHAGDLAVIAVAAGEVGVDVEHRSSGRGALDAAALACTPAEMESLGRLPTGERGTAFLGLWTAKEAYLKARGVGLSVSPDRVELGPRRLGAAMPVHLIGDPGRTQWWVRQLWLGSGYLGAVAAEGEDWRVEVRCSAELEVVR